MSLHGSTITITPIEPTDSITVTPNNTTVTATSNTTTSITAIPKKENQKLIKNSSGFQISWLYSFNLKQ